MLENVSPVDLLIHLGDAEGYEDVIGEMAGCPLEIVAGNNDFFSRLPKEKEIQIGKYRVWMTHGHYYYVSMGMETIIEEGRSRGADLVMFGHTHRPFFLQKDGMTYRACDRAESGQSDLSQTGGKTSFLYSDGP